MSDKQLSDKELSSKNASEQDEFHDMPDLGPARDDMDQPDIPTLEPVSDQPEQTSASPANRHTKPRPPRGLAYAVVLCLVLIAGLGFWFYTERVALQQQLTATQSNNAQLQVRLADIEQLVDAADESANKSGAALQAQLRRKIQQDQQRVDHVDSEIGKLWAIYQKYRPRIESMEQELKTVSGSLETLGLSMDKQSQAVSKAQSTLQQLDKQFTELQQNLSGVKETLAGVKQTQQQLSRFQEQVRGQYLTVQEQNDLQSVQLTKIQQRLDQGLVQPADVQQLRQLLNEHDKALESINAHRRQVNSELLRLRERIASVQTGP